MRGGSKALSQFLSEISDPASVCPKCGGKMSSHGTRTKNIVSLLGDGEVSRHYFICNECKYHLMPKDELLDIENTSFTPGVRRVSAKLAACDSFENSSAALEELCGIHVSSKDTERIAQVAGTAVEADNMKQIEKAFSCNEPNNCLKAEKIPIAYVEMDGTGVPVLKREVAGRKGKQEDGTARTREAKLGCIFTQTDVDENRNPIRDKNSTTYFGAIETSEAFGKRLYMEAMNRSILNAEKTVVLGDGARWIWNLAEEHFPNAIHIVDLFHAKERLWEFITNITSNANTQAELKREWYSLLEDGNIKELTHDMTICAVSFPNKKDDLLRQVNYYADNEARMRYSDFKKQGLFVGSGVVEAGCKNVIGKRLKQSGMHWSVNGANHIIALRCALLSGHFKELVLKHKAA